MKKPRLHLIAPYDARLRVDQPWFATAALTLAFAGLMRLVGYDVVEYCSGPSGSAAVEKIQVLSQDEFDAAFPTGFGQLGGAGHLLFDDRLRDLLAANVKPGDIVCHTRGAAHPGLVALLPYARHVEILVGYDAPPMPGVWRVFPSRAHQAWTLARYTPSPFYTPENVGVVIPHWVSPEEFHYTAADRPGREVLFAGRMAVDKVGILPHLIAERSDVPFVLVDQVPRELLRGLMARASVVLCPTTYLEPFGLVAVEAGMCGTPVLASDFGAFCETIDRPILGRRLPPMQVAAWLAAIDKPRDNSEGARIWRRDLQVERFGPAAVAARYDEFFRGLT